MPELDFSSLLIDNLQHYNQNFAKAPALLSDPDTIICGLHFSDAFVQSLLTPDHPQHRDNWRMLLWEICCDAPLLFHVVETNFRIMKQTIQYPDGKIFPVCFPTPEIDIEEYRKILAEFLPRWIRFSGIWGLRRKRSSPSAITLTTRKCWKWSAFRLPWSPQRKKLSVSAAEPQTPWNMRWREYCGMSSRHRLSPDSVNSTVISTRCLISTRFERVLNFS